MAILTKSDQQGAEQQPGHNGEPSITIPVIEEQLVVGKKLIDTGKVIISKSVTEHNEAIDIPLMHESVCVEHIPVNQYVETEPSIRYEGDTMIIPILREVLVKRILLVEEVHVTKQRVQTNRTENITLRQEVVQVERIKTYGAETKSL